MSSILAAGHSPKKEKKVANWLYVCIGVAIVIAFAVIFMSGGTAIKQNRDSAASAESAQTTSAPATPETIPAPQNPANPTDK